MKSIRVALILTLALPVVGCTSSEDAPGSIPTTGLTALPSESPWEPLASGQPSQGNPTPLSGRPSEKDLRRASRGNPSRVAAEEFALQLANFYIDVRPRLQDQVVLEKFITSDFSRTDERYTVQEKSLLRAGPIDRHYDPSVRMWIRSSATGPSAAPTRVEVEMAGNVLAPQLDHSAWFKVRVDAVRVNGAWQASTLNSAVTGPDNVGDLSPAERRELLTGGGWRHLDAG